MRYETVPSLRLRWNLKLEGAAGPRGCDFMATALGRGGTKVSSVLRSASVSQRRSDHQLLKEYAVSQICIYRSSSSPSCSLSEPQPFCSDQGSDTQFYVLLLHMLRVRSIAVITDHISSSSPRRTIRKGRGRPQRQRGTPCSKS